MNSTSTQPSQMDFAPNLSQEKPTCWRASTQLSPMPSRALQSTTDEHLSTPWAFKMGGKTVSENSRSIMISDAVFSHLAHHRGQLTVYLRLVESKVPAHLRTLRRRVHIESGSQAKAGSQIHTASPAKLCFVMLLASFLIVALAYLLGSIPTGYLLVKLFRHEDIRSVGSGNIGATNVLRSGGKGLGAATFLLDALKGAAAVWLGCIAGFRPCCRPCRFATHRPWPRFPRVLGHMFPVWLRFRGGKGVATGFGVFLVAAPLAALWLPSDSSRSSCLLTPLRLAGFDSRRRQLSRVCLVPRSRR